MSQFTALARSLVHRRYLWIAILASIGIAVHLCFRWLGPSDVWMNFPLWVVLALGGVPLVLELLGNLSRGEFGSDLLAGISIVTSVLLGEYLAGSLVVLMLSGGETLESYAVRSASSVLEALARRMPSVAHRRREGKLEDVPLEDVTVGDELTVLPHEFCPVDGTVVDGHGSMDESYLTGEPYLLAKAPGAQVISGAINGETALTIRADRLPTDSRYAKIMRVMRTSEQQRPRLRRLADQLGAFYTPLAVGIAVAAWLWSRDPVRFLAVVVVATPCPLLIAIPVAIIGAISLAARRSIVIKDPAAMEKIDTCRTAIFDKTGTLTYGRPQLTGLFPAEGTDGDQALRLAASLEQYSKHPLSSAVLEAARSRQLSLQEVSEISEEPGRGLTGLVEGVRVGITSRHKLQQANSPDIHQLPPSSPGLECVVLINDRYAATLQFRDKPRAEGKRFIHHLSPQHALNRILLVSGDRQSESQHLADLVGIDNVYASQSPEQKLEIVRAETKRANTLYLGDGINDAPAMVAATVGVAFGSTSDVTAEAAGVVILDNSLEKVDELMHISRRMRQIALQSAVGGMLLSLVAMGFAAAGYLPPVAGAVIQEIIDVVAVLNALRVSWPPKRLTDF